MKRTTVALVALIGVCSMTLHADVAIVDRGSWPTTWPKELDALRKTSRTIDGPLAGFLRYEISFTNRGEFEAAWPHLLKLRSPGYPITLVRSPHQGTGPTKGSAMKSGVIVSSWPIAASDADTKTKRSETTVIVVVVDGDVVDLNRIRLPGSTHIQDERFKDDGTPGEPGAPAATAEPREPISKDAAIRLAKDYLRTAHPEMAVVDQPPTATYVEKSPTDGKPLWVVGFVISQPKDASGFAPSYSQSVLVRSDGSVVLGPAASSS